MHVGLLGSLGIIDRLSGKDRKNKRRKKERGKEGRIDWRKEVREGGKKEGRRERRVRERSRRQASCYIPHKLFQEMIHIFMDKFLTRRWIGIFQKSMPFLNGSLHSCKVRGFNEIINSSMSNWYLNWDIGKNEILHWKIISTVYVFNVVFVYDFVMT